jgi:hypothetical protein
MTYRLLLLTLLGCSCAVGIAADVAAPKNSPPDPSCGLGPHDWCASPAGDPCGAHKDEISCRADAHCRGMPYRGESVVACMPDGKGFWSNCPAVGCVSRPNAK